MLTEFMVSLADISVEKLRNRDPEELEKTTQMFVHFVQLSVELLKASPEFRQAFAEIHSEFLRHPECESTIRQAVETYQELGYQ